MDNIQIVKTNANDITLSPSMYKDAEKMGLSLSQYLERLDPSETKDETDAFERQLRKYGIVVNPDVSKGIYASKVQDFFDNPIATKNVGDNRYFIQRDWPGSRVLFPEFINRVARVALSQTMNAEDIIASTRPITGGSFRNLDITTTTANKQKKAVAEGTLIPPTKISWAETAGTTRKYGIEIQMTYEAMRSVSLDLLQIIISGIVLQSQSDLFDVAFKVLDDAILASIVGYKAETDYDSAAAPGEITYSGWLGFTADIKPYSVNTVIGNLATIKKVLLTPKPTVDPIQLFSLLEKKSTVIGEGIKLLNSPWTNTNLIIYDNGFDDKLVGIDKRYALEKITEIGSDIQESERVISSQFEKIVLTESLAFSTIFSQAIRGMNIA